MLTATKAMTLKTGCLEQIVDPDLSRKACERMLKKLLELSNTADENRFFKKGCPTNFFTLLPQQCPQKRAYLTGRTWVHRAPAQLGVCTELL